MEVVILYIYKFIGLVLDFYLNHFIGNYSSIVFYNSNRSIKLLLVLNLLNVGLLFFLADYYDLKFGIIPNKLTLTLFICGLVFNIVLAHYFDNPSILLFALALTAIVAMISFILWHIGFWGGGDMKFFIGLSLSLSFFDLNYLNNIDIGHLSYGLNLAVSNQFIFYPKAFSILLNGILMAFAYIALLSIYHIGRNGQLKYYSILSLLDFNSFFYQLTTRSIHIDDLSEGMVLDKYYFDDENVFNMIKEDVGDSESSNLNLYEDENSIDLNEFKVEARFYLSSLNRMGLTEYDIELINDLHMKGLIKNPNFQVKKGIPFMPFLTLGYLGFLMFGDFIFIVSIFIKALF